MTEDVSEIGEDNVVDTKKICYDVGILVAGSIRNVTAKRKSK